MTLSDTQIIILSAASQRPDHVALPLPESLRGGAASKVVGALLAKGFLEEVDANLRKGEALWRTTGDGHGVTLVATKAGLDAIGVKRAPQRAAVAESETKAAETPAAADAAPKPPTVRDNTKQATMIAMLRQDDGATVSEIAEATGWQAHTVRGAFAGALKKRLGLTITSEKVEGRGRVYRAA